MQGVKLLPKGTGPLVEFTQQLHELRVRSGLSFGQMSDMSSYSPITLSNVTNGRELPSLAVLCVFVELCGGDAEAWRKRWQELKDLKKSGVRLWESGVQEVATFISNLVALKQAKGITYDQLAVAYGLSRATTHRYLTRQELPPRDFVRCLVALCGGDVEHWDAEWVKLVPIPDEAASRESNGLALLQEALRLLHRPGRKMTITVTYSP